MPTRDCSLVPARKVHVRGEDPHSVVKEADPQRTGARQPVDVKKMEIQPPSALHPGHQDSTCNYRFEKPIPSPTMPPLEDAEARFEYHEIGTTKILLPIEIRAKLIQTFPGLDQHTPALPREYKLVANEVNWTKLDNDAGQLGKAKSQQHSNSLPQTTDMGSHTKDVKPDTKVCNAISRLQKRNRLREMANRRLQASNNNNREHTLHDQDTVTNNQSTPTKAISVTHPLETKQCDQ